MHSIDIDFLLAMLRSFIIIVLVFTGLIFAYGAIDYYLVQNYTVRVQYAGLSTVYEGRKACVAVESAGDGTTITIGRGPLCILPGQTLVGNYTVETVK